MDFRFSGDRIEEKTQKNTEFILESKQIMSCSIAYDFPFRTANHSQPAPWRSDSEKNTKKHKKHLWVRRTRPAALHMFFIRKTCAMPRGCLLSGSTTMFVFFCVFLGIGSPGGRLWVIGGAKRKIICYATGHNLFGFKDEFCVDLRFFSDRIARGPVVIGLRCE